MFISHCNIDKNDRANRIVSGLLMLIAALLGAGKIFFIVLSVVLVVEGIIGWCSIPYLLNRLKRLVR